MAEAHDMRRSPTKVVQVPMDRTMIEELDEQAEKLGQSRSELIREACRRQLKRLEDEEIDREIEEGYARVPQDAAMGLAGLAAAGQVLEPEDW